MTEPSSTPEPKHLLERLLFMSDAVFAIVMTLLVLELRVPVGGSEADLIHGLREMTPKFISFAMSFALVAVFWVAHAAIMRNLLRFDWLVAWANLVMLFTLAWSPFAAALLGEYGASGTAWRIYCVTLIAIGAAQVFLLLAISRGKGRLVGGLGGRDFWYRLIRASAPSTGFAVALVFSLMGHPQVSYLSWVIIPLIMVGARLVLTVGRKKAGVGAVPSAPV